MSWKGVTGLLGNNSVTVHGKLALHLYFTVYAHLAIDFFNTIPGYFVKITVNEFIVRVGRSRPTHGTICL